MGHGKLLSCNLAYGNVYFKVSSMSFPERKVFLVSLGSLLDEQLKNAEKLPTNYSDMFK